MSLTKAHNRMIADAAVNVKDFGAVGDGVADDTSAIQAALNNVNGTRKKLQFSNGTFKINSPLSLNNFSNFVIDFGQCNINFNGASGEYLFDLTQAGNIDIIGGFFTGTGNICNFLKTKGSSSSQSTIFPTIPSEDQWSRSLRLQNITVTGFANVLDFENFTREVWVENCYFTQNLKVIAITGKVVNLHVNSTVLFSSLASSEAIVCRGDSGDSAWRYAEGLFFNNCICDTQGYAVDVQDLYLMRFSGGQIQSPAVGVAVTKGITPLTRNFFFTDVQFNGKTIIGSGLSSQFLFDGFFSGVFQDIADTAIGIVGFAKNISISGQFDTPTGTPVALSVGPNCLGISFDATIDGAYTTKLSVDATSVAGVTPRVTGSWSPRINFGGAEVGITYTLSEGRYEWNGSVITAFFKISLSNKGSSTGSATISGLPYPAILDGAGALGKYSAFNSAINIFTSVESGSQSINLKTSGTGSEVLLTDADFSNSSILNGSIQYIVNTQ